MFSMLLMLIKYLAHVVFTYFFFLSLMIVCSWKITRFKIKL